MPLLKAAAGAAFLIFSHRDTETQRKVKSKGRQGYLAFLINSDLPFLCDSVADFAFFINLLIVKIRIDSDRHW